MMRAPLPRWRFKWLPASLLGRIALAIALVALTSQLVLSHFVKNYLDDQRLRQDADLIDAQVETIRAAFAALPPGERAAVRLRLHKAGILQNQPPATAQPSNNVTDAAWLTRLAGLLRARFGTDIRLRSIPGPNGALCVFTPIDGTPTWLLLPWHRSPDDSTRNVFIMIGLIGLLSFLGGFLIVRHLNRPLARLAEAAQSVGRGEFPPPVPIDGAAELATLSQSFNHMVDALGRLDADRNLMLAGVSHDLRTPLTRIRLRAEMLEESDLRRTRTGMIRDIEFMDGIVNQFLDFARAQQSEEVEDTDLDELIRGVIERYEAAGVPIHADLIGLPPVPVRPLAMKRLVTNLIDNAVKHGGAAVRVTTALEDERVLVRVLDRGPGVTQQALPRLTEPFFRPDTSRGQGGGTGLGLAIVVRIAQLHHGEFNLLPRPEGGLEARLSLPLRG